MYSLYAEDLTLLTLTSIKKRKIDNPRYYQINNFLSLAFLTKHLPLAALSISGLVKLNLP